MRISNLLNEASLDDALKRAKGANDSYNALLKYTEKNGWIHPDRVFDGLHAPIIPMFRGTKTIKDRFNHVQRTDRRPTDTPYETHIALDDYFFKHFDWKPRSESLMVTPNLLPTARSYSGDNTTLQCYMIFPKGNFKYVWSPKVTDLYIEVREEKTLNLQSTNRDMVTKIKEFEKKLDSFGYTDNGLSSNDKCEIMLHAPSYVFVNAIYFPAYCLKYNIPFNKKHEGFYQFIKSDIN